METVHNLTPTNAPKIVFIKDAAGLKYLSLETKSPYYFLKLLHQPVSLYSELSDGPLLLGTY